MYRQTAYYSIGYLTTFILFGLLEEALPAQYALAFFPNIIYNVLKLLTKKLKKVIINKEII